MEQVQTTGQRDGDEPTSVPEPEAAPDDGSLLSRIKARRRELQKTRTLDLEIAGYDGMLVARYKPLAWDVVKKIGEKVEKSKHPRKELYAQADVIARACDAIYFKDDEGNLRDPKSGQDVPVRYDDVLADILDLNGADTARKVVIQTFDNDLALTAHHNELAEWMQASDSEVDEELLGESPAATER